MMYVYNVKDFEDNEVQEVIDNGLAVALTTDDLMKVLSRFDSLGISDEVISPECKLDEWIDYFNGCQYVNIKSISGDTLLQPTIEESITILQDALYEDRGGTVLSYAERIYRSNDPTEEISKILEECVVTVLAVKIDEINMAMNGLKLSIKDGSFEWD